MSDLLFHTSNSGADGKSASEVLHRKYSSGFAALKDKISNHRFTVKICVFGLVREPPWFTEFQPDMATGTCVLTCACLTEDEENES